MSNSVAVYGATDRMGRLITRPVDETDDLDLGTHLATAAARFSES